jgi:hypothetical protein
MQRSCKICIYNCINHSIFGPAIFIRKSERHSEYIAADMTPDVNRLKLEGHVCGFSPICFLLRLLRFVLRICDAIWKTLGHSLLFTISTHRSYEGSQDFAGPHGLGLQIGLPFLNSKKYWDRHREATMAIMAIIDRFSKHLQTSPNSGVDFPRITEICQRVADRPDEVCRGLPTLGERAWVVGQWLALLSLGHWAGLSIAWFGVSEFGRGKFMRFIPGFIKDLYCLLWFIMILFRQYVFCFRISIEGSPRDRTPGRAERSDAMGSFVEWGQFNRGLWTFSDWFILMLILQFYAILA